MKKAIHILFLCGVFALLLVGLVRTIFFSKEINTYENRYASQMPTFTVAGFLEGTFQDGVEAALMDQVNGAQSMKQLYNRCTTQTQKSLLDAMAGTAGLDGTQYVNFGGLRLFGDDYITYWPRYPESVQAELNAKIESLNGTFARHPELDFYVYYIEKDTDIDFETGEKTGLKEALLPRLNLPAEQVGVYTIDSFAEFSQCFYQTDAHWKHTGSYRAYREVIDFLGCKGEPLVPTGDAVLVSDSFSGKKASSVAGEGVFTEEFYGYPFAFPAMTVKINGESGADYGEQEAYLSGTAWDPVSYGGYYGGDNGETILSTNPTGFDAILVVGESFDNALLNLLSCHYDNLYSIDLRYYDYAMGHPFDLTAYTKEHGISKVLLIGNIDYFIQDTFDLEG